MNRQGEKFISGAQAFGPSPSWIIDGSSRLWSSMWTSTKEGWDCQLTSEKFAGSRGMVRLEHWVQFQGWKEVFCHDCRLFCLLPPSLAYPALSYPICPRPPPVSSPSLSLFFGFSHGAMQLCFWSSLATNLNLPPWDYHLILRSPSLTFCPQAPFQPVPISFPLQCPVGLCETAVFYFGFGFGISEGQWFVSVFRITIPFWFGRFESVLEFW